MTQVPEPMGPALPGTKQVVVSFDLDSARNGRLTYTAVTYVQIDFLPCGLLLWGVTEDTYVRSIKAGNYTGATADGMPIPGRYFAQGHSFDQIIAMAECNELDLAVEARQQLEMNELAPGCAVSLTLSGPCTQACVWGRTFATVERAGQGFVGRVDRVGLRGIDTVLETIAPSEEAAVALIGVMTGRRHV